MTLRTKRQILPAVYLLGGFLILLFSTRHLTDGGIVAALFGWLFLAAIGQYYFFRCPGCHRSVAFPKKKGIRVPLWAIERCPYCGTRLK